MRHLNNIFFGNTSSSAFGFKQRYCFCLLVELTKLFPDLWFLIMLNKQMQQLIFYM